MKREQYSAEITEGQLATVCDASETSCGDWSGLKTAAVLTGAAIGGIAAVNAVIALRTPPLGAALGGVFNRYPSRYGDLAYTVKGSGSPILLLHATSPGGSMAEWRYNFDELARHHTVYAFDFLGWGLSDKPSQSYAAEDLIEQVQYFAEDIVGAPCALVASGPSCAFAIHAAHRTAQHFSRVVLVCPSSSDTPSGEARSQRRIMSALLGVPVLGTALYNFLHSRRRLEAFARQQLYFDKERVDEAVVRRYHVATHQPGARHGAASQGAGLLEVDWSEAWSELKIPALLVWGRNVLLGGLDTAPEWLALKADADLEVIDRAMLLPHVEQAPEFNRVVLDWLSKLPGEQIRGNNDAKSPGSPPLRGDYS
ncbi:MAG TPA: alpha/beta fold hydrolase [Abditibacteriaceae bacterium]|nr:alpha/beta fold hydrolase [Abditibacteriaceae bacterium]